MTEVKNYRKLPVVIEAMQFDGTILEAKGIYEWIRSYGQHAYYDVGGLFISTLEGEMLVSPMDWIIKGVKGEFYPCKPEIFEATYEEAKDD